MDQTFQANPPTSTSRSNNAVYLNVNDNTDRTSSVVPSVSSTATLWNEDNAEATLGTSARRSWWQRFDRGGRAESPKLVNVKAWLERDVMAFFLLGLLVPSPMTTAMSSSRLMFPGITGLMGPCFAVPAAICSFTLPLIATRIPYWTMVIINAVVGTLSLCVCTIGTGLPGPILGAALTGICSAIGQYLYMAVAASYDEKVVISYSIGSRLIFIIRAPMYMGLMAAFDQSWQWSLRTVAPLCLAQLAIWFYMLSTAPRKEADQVRHLMNQKFSKPNPISKRIHHSLIVDALDSQPFADRSGFTIGGLSKVGLLFRVIFPQYTLPLMTIVMGMMIIKMGLAPSFIELETFYAQPDNDLNYQLVALFAGIGEFLFSLISLFRPLHNLWGWALTQCLLVALAASQLAYPSLVFYAVWLALTLLAGGCEGGAVTNTNHKVAQDFRERGERDEVRAFAMSYAGLGNFTSDLVGGGIAIMIETSLNPYGSRRVWASSLFS